MSFSGVTWAYKDVITSAKLAQMVENLRTHDHLTVDQGAPIGLLSVLALDVSPNQTINSTTATLITGSSVTLTLPTGIPAGRRLVAWVEPKLSAGASTTSVIVDVVHTAGASTSAGGTAFGTPSPTYLGGAPTSPQAVSALRIRGGAPPSGQYTFATRLTYGSASASNIVTFLNFLLAII